MHKNFEPINFTHGGVQRRFLKQGKTYLLESSDGWLISLMEDNHPDVFAAIDSTYESTQLEAEVLLEASHLKIRDHEITHKGETYRFSNFAPGRAYVCRGETGAVLSFGFDPQEDVFSIIDQVSEDLLCLLDALKYLKKLLRKKLASEIQLVEVN
jgi:hypothetical protein